MYIFVWKKDLFIYLLSRDGSRGNFARFISTSNDSNIRASGAASYITVNFFVGLND